MLKSIPRKFQFFTLFALCLLLYFSTTQINFAQEEPPPIEQTEPATLAPPILDPPTTIPTDTVTLIPTEALTHTETATTRPTDTLTLTPTETLSLADAFTATATTDTLGLPPEPPLAPLLLEPFDYDTLNWRHDGSWHFTNFEAETALQVTNSSAMLFPFAEPTMLSDSVVEVRFHTLTGTLNLALRQSGAGSYRLSIDPTGFVQLLRGDVVLATRTVGAATTLWRTIRLSAIHDVLRVSIDGVELLTVVDPLPLPPGEIALFTLFPPVLDRNSAEQQTLYLDTLAIWTPQHLVTSTPTTTATQELILATLPPPPTEVPVIVQPTASPLATATPTNTVTPIAQEAQFAPPRLAPNAFARSSMSSFIPSSTVGPFSIADGNEADLIDAILEANAECPNDNTTVVINLATNGNYVLEAPFSGENGLPPIECRILINGNGATIERDSASLYDFRIILVTGSGDLTLDDVTIRGGRVNYSGAGIFNNTGALTVLNSTIEYNAIILGLETYDLYGAGIFTTWGTLLIEDSIIQNNYNAGIANFDGNARSGGGGLTSGDGALGQHIVRRTQFLNNVSDDLGGAIHSTWTNLIIEDSLFVNNDAAYRGGGLYSGSSSINISGVTQFNNNSAGDNGAAVGGFTVSMNGGCIVGNDAGSVLAVFSPNGATFDFSENWWGDASGPSGSGDSVSSGVNYSNWLTTPPLDCAPPTPSPTPTYTLTPTPNCSIQYDYDFRVTPLANITILNAPILTGSTWVPAYGTYVSGEGYKYLDPTIRGTRGSGSNRYHSTLSLRIDFDEPLPLSSFRMETQSPGSHQLILYATDGTSISISHANGWLMWFGWQNFYPYNNAPLLSKYFTHAIYHGGWDHPSSPTWQTSYVRGLSYSLRSCPFPPPTATPTPTPTEPPTPTPSPTPAICTGDNMALLSSSSLMSCLTPTPPLPACAIDPNSTLADFGIVLIGEWEGENENEQINEQAEILAAARETGRALCLHGAGVDQTSVSAFREVLQGRNNEDTLRSIEFNRGGSGGFCTTNKTNGNPEQSASITCSGGLTINQYTAVHEFGHVLVGRTGSLYLNALSSANIDDENGRHLFGQRTLSLYGGGSILDWQRSDHDTDHGWGDAAQFDPSSGNYAIIRSLDYVPTSVPNPTEGPAPTGEPRYHYIPVIGRCDGSPLVTPTGTPPVISTPPAFTVPLGSAFPFQQNPCTFPNIYGSEGAKMTEVEEAGSDMFLNWVYWKATGGASGFQNMRWRTAGYLVNQCWSAGCPDNTGIPGDIRANWMDETLTAIFTQSGWISTP